MLPTPSIAFNRFRRSDGSALSRWWWTVDRVSVGLFITLAVVGTVAVTAAGTSVADTVNMEFRSRFALKHLLFSLAALTLMLRASFLSIKAVRRLGTVLFLIIWPMLALTPFIGTAIKGAKRWIYLGPLHLQPSELIKPGLMIAAARLMSQPDDLPKIPFGKLLSFVLLIAVISPLLMQPDVGQTLLLTASWLAMLFVSGASALWFAAAAAAAIPAGLLLYYIHPHVHRRINDFLFDDTPDVYGSSFQAVKAREALYSGGWWGKGPGEGVVKRVVPDAHSDYILAVIGEEFGLLACMLPMLFYIVILYRSLRLLMVKSDRFAVTAGTGLLLLPTLQAFINMAVNLGMFPPKGMTLPLVSYGGSSSLSVGLTAGLLLALSRK